MADVLGNKSFGEDGRRDSFQKSNRRMTESMAKLVTTSTDADIADGRVFVPPRCNREVEHAFFTCDRWLRRRRVLEDE